MLCSAMSMSTVRSITLTGSFKLLMSTVFSTTLTGFINVNRIRDGPILSLANMVLCNLMHSTGNIFRFRKTQRQQSARVAWALNKRRRKPHFRISPLLRTTGAFYSSVPRLRVSIFMCLSVCLYLCISCLSLCLFLWLTAVYTLSLAPNSVILYGGPFVLFWFETVFY